VPATPKVTFLLTFEAEITNSNIPDISRGSTQHDLYHQLSGAEATEYAQAVEPIRLFRLEDPTCASLALRQPTLFEFNPGEQQTYRE